MFDRMVREVNKRALGGGWGRSETETDRGRQTERERETGWESNLFINIFIKRTKLKDVHKID